MNKEQEKQIRKWCKDNNWTDLFLHENKFYAFPPHAVIPLPVPIEDNKINYESRRCDQLLYLATAIDLFIFFQMLSRFLLFPWLSLKITLTAIFGALCVLALVELYTSICRKYDLRNIFRYPLIIISMFFISYQVFWIFLASK